MLPERTLSRRIVLDAGRGALAVAILAVAGCSSGGGSTASGSGSSGGTSTGPPSDPASSSAPAIPPAGPDDTGPLTWARANLGFVSAYVLVRGSQAAVVDTGVAGSADAIGEVLATAGPGWAGVRHVVLTHHHPDHAGSIGDVLTRATSATAHIGEADLGHVTSPRPLVAAADGSEVFGLQVVATPGHTAGHISVFDAATGLLVAGDALNNSAGLAGSNPQFTADEAAARASVARLAALPVRTVLFGHGEPLDAGAAAALKRLAAG
jgi:glyoxylase-like metal-dependent hydrolase (beta-lactamase superfamily II)